MYKPGERIWVLMHLHFLPDLRTPPAHPTLASSTSSIWPTSGFDGITSKTTFPISFLIFLIVYTTDCQALHHLISPLFAHTNTSSQHVSSLGIASLQLLLHPHPHSSSTLHSWHLALDETLTVPSRAPWPWPASSPKQRPYLGIHNLGFFL